MKNFIETIKEFNKEFFIQTRYAFSLPKKNYHSMEQFTKNSQHQLKNTPIMANTTSMKRSFDDSFFEAAHKKINLICNNAEEKKECYREINDILSN